MSTTIQGEPVRIVAADPTGWLAQVQSIEDPTWIRDRHLADLRADDGMAEIKTAISNIEDEPAHDAR